MIYLFKTYLLAILVFGVNVSAQEQTHADKTSSFKVWGNCSMCKQKIEKAAKMKGVKKVKWNVESKIMTLTYDSTKVSVEKVQKAIAAIGYDTEKYKGDDKAYAKLPGCCQYERK